MHNRKLLNSKRSQSEIITTVLIILLVLAAIVIVWQVVKSTVEKGSEQVSSASDCIRVSLNVESAILDNSASNAVVVVKRGQDSADLQNVKVIVEDNGGTQFCNGLSGGTMPDALGKVTLTAVSCTTPPVAETSYNVKIAPVIGLNQCDITSEKSFIAVA